SPAEKSKPVELIIHLLGGLGCLIPTILPSVAGGKWVFVAAAEAALVFLVVAISATVGLLSIAAFIKFLKRLNHSADLKLAAGASSPVTRAEASTSKGRRAASQATFSAQKILTHLSQVIVTFESPTSSPLSLSGISIKLLLFILIYLGLSIFAQFVQVSTGKRAGYEPIEHTAAKVYITGFSREESSLVGNLFFSPGQEDYGFGSVAEDDIKKLKNIFSPYEIETNAEPRGKTDGGPKRERADSNRQDVQVNRNYAAIPDSYEALPAFLIGNPDSYGVINGENRERSTAVYIAFRDNPSIFSAILNLDGDNRTIKNIRESYLLHVKMDSRSSFRGMGVPIGEVLYFFLNSFSVLAMFDSLVGKTLWLAISTYSPPYLSTNNLKFFSSHFWSSIFFILAVPLCNYTLSSPVSQGKFVFGKASGPAEGKLDHRVIGLSVTSISGHPGIEEISSSLSIARSPDFLVPDFLITGCAYTSSSPAAFSSLAPKLQSSSAVRSGAQQLSSLAAKGASSPAGSELLLIELDKRKGLFETVKTEWISRQLARLSGETIKIAPLTKRTGLSPTEVTRLLKKAGLWGHYKGVSKKESMKWIGHNEEGFMLAEALIISSNITWQEIERCLKSYACSLLNLTEEDLSEKATRNAHFIPSLYSLLYGSSLTNHRAPSLIPRQKRILRENFGNSELKIEEVLAENGRCSLATWINRIKQNSAAKRPTTEDIWKLKRQRYRRREPPASSPAVIDEASSALKVSFVFDISHLELGIPEEASSPAVSKKISDGHYSTSLFSGGRSYQAENRMLSDAGVLNGSGQSQTRLTLLPLILGWSLPSLTFYSPSVFSVGWIIVPLIIIATAAIAITNLIKNDNLKISEVPIAPTSKRAIFAMNLAKYLLLLVFQNPFSSDIENYITFLNGSVNRFILPASSPAVKGEAMARPLRAAASPAESGKRAATWDRRRAQIELGCAGDGNNYLREVSNAVRCLPNSARIILVSSSIFASLPLILVNSSFMPTTLIFKVVMSSVFLATIPIVASILSLNGPWLSAIALTSEWTLSRTTVNSRSRSNSFEFLVSFFMARGILIQPIANVKKKVSASSPAIFIKRKVILPIFILTSLLNFTLFSTVYAQGAAGFEAFTDYYCPPAAQDVTFTFTSGRVVNPLRFGLPESYRQSLDWLLPAVPDSILSSADTENAKAYVYKELIPAMEKLIADYPQPEEEQYRLTQSLIDFINNSNFRRLLIRSNYRGSGPLKDEPQVIMDVFLKIEQLTTKGFEAGNINVKAGNIFARLLAIEAVSNGLTDLFPNDATRYFDEPGLIAAINEVFGLGFNVEPGLKEELIFKLLKLYVAQYSPFYISRYFPQYTQTITSHINYLADELIRLISGFNALDAATQKEVIWALWYFTDKAIGVMRTSQDDAERQQFLGYIIDMLKIVKETDFSMEYKLFDHPKFRMGNRLVSVIVENPAPEEIATITGVLSLTGYQKKLWEEKKILMLDLNTYKNRFDPGDRSWGEAEFRVIYDFVDEAEETYLVKNRVLKGVVGLTREIMKREYKGQIIGTSTVSGALIVLAMSKEQLRFWWYPHEIFHLVQDRYLQWLPYPYIWEQFMYHYNFVKGLKLHTDYAEENVFEYHSELGGGWADNSLSLLSRARAVSNGHFLEMVKIAAYPFLDASGKNQVRHFTATLKTDSLGGQYYDVESGWWKIDLDTAKTLIAEIYEEPVTQVIAPESKQYLGIAKGSLYQSYPNPFYLTTTIRYALPTAENILLVVFNTSGQRVKTLVETHQESGEHEVVWDGRNDNGQLVSDGVYLVQVIVNGLTTTKKMTFLKGSSPAAFSSSAPKFIRSLANPGAQELMSLRAKETSSPAGDIAYRQVGILNGLGIIIEDYLMASRRVSRWEWSLTDSLISAMSVFIVTMSVFIVTMSVFIVTMSVFIVTISDFIILMSALMINISSFCLPNSSKSMSKRCFTDERSSANRWKSERNFSNTTANSLSLENSSDLSVFFIATAILSYHPNSVKDNLLSILAATARTLRLSTVAASSPSASSPAAFNDLTTRGVEVLRPAVKGEAMARLSAEASTSEGRRAASPAELRQNNNIRYHTYPLLSVGETKEIAAVCEWYEKEIYDFARPWLYSAIKELAILATSGIGRGISAACTILMGIRIKRAPLESSLAKSIRELEESYNTKVFAVSLDKPWAQYIIIFGPIKPVDILKSILYLAGALAEKPHEENLKLAELAESKAAEFYLARISESADSTQSILERFLSKDDTPAMIEVYERLTLGDMVDFVDLSGDVKIRTRLLAEMEELFVKGKGSNLGKEEEWRIGRAVIIGKDEQDIAAITVEEASPWFSDILPSDASASYSREISFSKDSVTAGELFLLPCAVQIGQFVLCIGEKLEVDSYELVKIYPENLGLNSELQGALLGTAISYGHNGYQILFTSKVTDKLDHFCGHAIPLTYSYIEKLLRSGSLRRLGPYRSAPSFSMVSSPVGNQATSNPYLLPTNPYLLTQASSPAVITEFYLAIALALSVLNDLHKSAYFIFIKNNIKCFIKLLGRDYSLLIFAVIVGEVVSDILIQDNLKLFNKAPIRLGHFVEWHLPEIFRGFLAPFGLFALSAAITVVNSLRACLVRTYFSAGAIFGFFIQHDVISKYDLVDFALESFSVAVFCILNTLMGFYRFHRSSSTAPPGVTVASSPVEKNVTTTPRHQATSSYLLTTEPYLPTQ
ncbi:MAG: FlgD immunoglobulin-like domain containing protein, partial [Candidatus Omnitrophota bacterium]